ncbi:ArnT family glycosyltransferase [Acinetobacter soli]|uniref:Dolichyl-phosphate-mannose--protein mannosyltransferase n=2 Tax=Gammaproteobacteria TaxID=1236 RepID=A0A1P8EIH0_9GAMM|nr:glycosyltransferase family 39 protein [Acinetobacter soli]APV35997.1 dolichyl-phosphate-mannose--protein mannosyltransferase [Acinetobacter soli]KQC95139.1 dolichyl-phosphate-mannose-protein mannosyltransferase [Acinetobacter soli]MCB8768481.1 glycosyltransferase family 39 protein [Acinetobacter soli]MDQ8942200.1 glycosyltransferase family 39 protein [Acinetobacter soli]WND05454.1 glycosyltransferase family 39 protein [Acinetobacter soli]
MSSWLRTSPIKLGLISVWLFVCATVRFLSIPDEGRYADISRHMFESGDWLVPRLDGLPFIHKPPMLHWLSSIAMHIFGVHVWVVRLVPVLAASLLLIGTYLFVRKYLSQKIAELSILMMATNLLFFGSSQYVNHDLLLATGITLSVFCLVDFSLCNRKAMLFLGYFFAASAFLTKGLIGILIPGMILLPWLLYTRQYKRIPAFFNPFALLFLAALTLPWLYQMQQIYPDFLHYFFIDQQFNRFHSNQFNNKQSWFFYLVILLVSLLPWLLTLRWTGLRTMLQQQRLNPIGQLLIWWLVSVVIFFSIPPSKLAGYILPALTPLIILCAVAFEKSTLNTQQLTRMQKYAPAAFVCLLGFVLAATLYFIPLDFNLSSVQKWQITLMAALLVYSPLLFLQLLHRHKLEYAHYVAACLIVLCSVVPFATRIFDIKNNHDQINFTAYIHPNTKVVFYDRYYYDLPFLLDLKQPVYVVTDWQNNVSDNYAQELSDGLQFEPERRAYLWTRAQLNGAIDRKAPMIVISSSHDNSLEQQAKQVIHNRNFDVLIFNE